MTYSSAYAPVPSPVLRERGAEGGVRAIQPRAYALGYSMPPLTGLSKTNPHSNCYCSSTIATSHGLTEIDCEWLTPLPVRRSFPAP
jgi:hypothetical protein